LTVTRDSMTKRFFKQSVVTAYLDLLDSQRETFFLDSGGIDDALLWCKPEELKWSAGEHLDHAKIALRSLRRTLEFYCRVAYPYAYLRRKRVYPVEIDDVYQRPDFPLWVGIFWPSKHCQRKPLTMQQLQANLAKEHRTIRRFFQSKDPDVLGNMYFYDPVIGWINMIQALRIGAFHDQHHYDLARKIGGGGAG